MTIHAYWDASFAEEPQGCRTCRRRKVKCDERHPSCKRCDQLHLDCEGYFRDYRFVDEVTRTLRHADKANSVSKSPLQDLAATTCTPEASLIALPEVPHLPPSLSLLAFEQDIFTSFLYSRLLGGLDKSPSWMDLARMYAEGAQLTTAKHSFKALSTLYFGRMNRQPEIIARAFAPYGAALRNLNKDLQDPSKATSLSVVISAITLQTFEVRNPLNYTFRS